MARLDLSKVNVMNFLPEGENECTIVKIESQLTKEKKEPMEVFTFRDRLGREDRQFFTLGEKNLFRIKGLAIAAGMPAEGAHWATFDTGSLRGKRLLVVKKKIGMRQIITESGPKDVPDYEFAYAQASGAQPASGSSTPAGEDDIPF